MDEEIIKKLVMTKNTNELKRLQRAATKILSGLRELPCEEGFEKTWFRDS